MNEECFNHDAHTFSHAHRGWQVDVVRDALGNEHTVLKLTNVGLPPKQHPLATCSPPPSLPTPEKQQTSECADDDCAPREMSDRTLLVDYFVSFHEAYQTPVINFACRWMQSGAVMADIDALQKVYMPSIGLGYAPSSTCEDGSTGADGSEKFSVCAPSPSVIVSHDFFELLHRAMFFVHACDMGRILQMWDDVAAMAPPGAQDGGASQQQGAGRCSNSIECLLEVVGPMINLPLR